MQTKMTEKNLEELKNSSQLDRDLGIATPASMALPSSSAGIVKQENQGMPVFKENYKAGKTTYLFY